MVIIVNDVKDLIIKLTEQEKLELLKYLKTIVNNEFNASENNLCQCSNCNSYEIVKYGTYNGIQRYRCKKCLITFTSKTKTIFSTTKLEKDKWLKYIECFVDCLSLRRSAEKVGVCLKTSYFMRHRIIECLKSNQSQFIVNKNNKGQLDETFLRENFKGNHTKSKNFTMPRKPRRNGQEYKATGTSNEQICIASGINDTNHVFLKQQEGAN